MASEGKKNFVEEMKADMRVKTPFGKGTIKSIIEDIHCHVNVLLDTGELKNIMLHKYDSKTDKLKLNLDYE